MILVTGALGMVGSYVKDVFLGEKLALTDLPDMDVTDKDKVFGLAEKYMPSTVLHLAAETDVDKCETEKEHAFAVNAEGTKNVALACKKFNAEMIYISTGGVFGDDKRVHTESDAPNPLSVYAKAKYEGEKHVSSLLDRYYIFRAGWMIGGGPKRDKKFVGKMIELMKTRDRIEAVNDKTGSPTFARDFMAGIKFMIKTGKYGLYHLVNKGVVTRYDIAVELAKLLKRKIEVVPVTSDRFPLPAPRAVSEAMENYSLSRLGFDIMPDWKESLKKYVDEWQKE